MWPQHLVDPAQFRALDAYLAQAYAKVRGNSWGHVFSC